MKKQYVPKTLTEYLGESKSITLKRKYGERPTISVGGTAPLRNSVLAYVAESGSVSKNDLKRYILGLKEGGSTVASANMFIKRNARYFITENKNGVTFFKLSDLGQRLVNRFVTTANQNVSESKVIVEKAKQKLSSILENKRRMSLKEEAEEDEIDDQDEVPEDDEIIASRMNGEDEEENPEGPAEEVDFDEDRFTEDELESNEEGHHTEADQFEYEEDDEKITLTYWKQPKEDEGEIDVEDELDADDLEREDEDVDEEDFDENEETEEDFEDEEDMSERPTDEEPREYDFKDKGRPGVLGMDESAKVMRAQFVSHKLTGKKSPNLGGKLDKKLHNLLPDGQDKDPNELKESYSLDLMLSEEFENYVQGLIDLDDVQEAKMQLKELFDNNPKMHTLTGEIEGKDTYKKGLDMFREYYGSKRSTLESVEELERIKNKLNNVKNLNEAEEPSESDELSDEDLKKLGSEEEPEKTEEEPVEDETGTTLDGEEDVEKIEITEFIITVDNVEEAIDELAELGVTAERVPVEPPKEEELPAEVEEPEMPEKELTDEDIPTEEKPEEEKVKECSESIDEAEEEKPTEDVDLGTSDELGLGDQGKDADELEDVPSEESEENLEATTEFEENKIKVKADQWPTLKTWLEEKSVNISDMFGGDIEMEEVPEDDIETEVSEEPTEEIDDSDIDFSGVGEEDETKVKEE